MSPLSTKKSYTPNRIKHLHVWLLPYQTGRLRNYIGITTMRYKPPFMVNYYSSPVLPELVGIVQFHKSSKRSNHLLKVLIILCMTHIHRTIDRRWLAFLLFYYVHTQDRLLLSLILHFACSLLCRFYNI